MNNMKLTSYINLKKNKNKIMMLRLSKTRKIMMKMMKISTYLNK